MKKVVKANEEKKNSFINCCAYSLDLILWSAIIFTSIISFFMAYKYVVYIWGLDYISNINLFKYSTKIIGCLILLGVGLFYVDKFFEKGIITNGDINQIKPKKLSIAIQVFILLLWCILSYSIVLFNRFIKIS